MIAVSTDSEPPEVRKTRASFIGASPTSRSASAVCGRVGEPIEDVKHLEPAHLGGHGFGYLQRGRGRHCSTTGLRAHRRRATLGVCHLGALPSDDLDEGAAGGGGPSKRVKETWKTGIRCHALHPRAAGPPELDVPAAAGVPALLLLLRREGDSNPRGSSPNGFQDRRNRPLCHPSEPAVRFSQDTGAEPRRLGADGLAAARTRVCAPPRHSVIAAPRPFVTAISLCPRAGSSLSSARNFENWFSDNTDFFSAMAIALHAIPVVVVGVFVGAPLLYQPAGLFSSGGCRREGRTASTSASARAAAIRSRRSGPCSPKAG